MRMIRPEGCSLENPKLASIKEKLFNGKISKIQAIKEYREYNGREFCGLREAKDEVDRWIYSVGELIPEISQFKMIDEYRATCVISFPNEALNQDGKKFFPIEIKTNGGWFSVEGFSLSFDLSVLKNLVATEQKKAQTKRIEEEKKRIEEEKKRIEEERKTRSIYTSSQSSRKLGDLIGIPISWNNMFKCWMTSSGIRFRVYGIVERRAEMTFEILSVPRLSAGQFSRMLETFGRVTGQTPTFKGYDALKKILEK